MALAFLIQLPPSLWSFFLLLGINIVSDCLGAYCSGLQLPYVRRLVPADTLDSAMGFQMACQTTVQIVFQGIGAWGIILLNNNGGGIFSFLSQNTLEPNDFVPLFGTPLGLEFQKVAALYEADWHTPTSLLEFQTILAETSQQPRFQIIEVKGEQKDPVNTWQALQQHFSEAGAQQ